MADTFWGSLGEAFRIGTSADTVVDSADDMPEGGLPITKAAFTPSKAIGSSVSVGLGGQVFVQERQPALIGGRRFDTFDAMVKDCTIVAAGVRLFLNLMAKAEWTVNPAEDQETNPRAQEIADLVYDMMFDMGTPWSTVVRKQAMYRFQGFALQEWIAKKRPDGAIGMADVQNRPQRSITRWKQDASGAVIAAIQTNAEMKEVELPRGKVIYTVDDMLTESPEGMGLYRHLAVTSNRLKSFLDLEEVGFETDLRGIPVARAPMGELLAEAKEAAIREPTPEEVTAAGNSRPGAKAKIKAAAEAVRNSKLQPLKDFVTNHIRNKKTGVLLPSDTFQSTGATGTEAKTPSSVHKWALELLQGESTSFEAIAKAIDRMNAELARVLGVEHLLLGGDGSGSLALARSKVGTFYLTVTATLNELVEVFERDWLQPIVDLNGWPPELVPSLGVAEIREEDIEQITAALANMAQAGAVIQPNDPVIGEVRDILGLSRPPEETMDLDASLNPNRNTTPDPDQQVQSDQNDGITKRRIIWSRRSAARRRRAGIPDTMRKAA